jgi:hypothetical protein
MTSCTVRASCTNGTHYRTDSTRCAGILIGDKGFAGQDFEDWSPQGTGCTWSARPPRRGAPARIDRLDPAVVESVNDTLKSQLDLERHGGRTPEGIYTRIVQRLLAMAVCIWHNWASGQHVKRSLTAYDN